MITFRRKHIVFDGHIGAGKTTLARAVAEEMRKLLRGGGDNPRFASDGGRVFHLPPTATWGTSFSEAVAVQPELPSIVLNKVMESYKDPSCDNFYDAQMAVQVGRMADRYNAPPAIVHVHDRAVFSDSVFISSLAAQGKLTESMRRDLLEHQQRSCLNWFDFFHAKESDLISVYLDTPIDVCIERIKMRGRIGEESLTADYLEFLRDNGGHPLSDPLPLQHPPAYSHEAFRKLTVNGNNYAENLVWQLLPAIFAP